MNWPDFENVPLTQSDRNNLIAQRPLAWEHLLFVSTVLDKLKASEPSYLDYLLRYSDRSGPTVEGIDIANYASRAMDEMLFLISNLVRVFDTENQVRAFGVPGESGDAEITIHLGRRFADSYSALVNWGLDVFAWRIKDDDLLVEIRDLMASMVRKPIADFRQFFFDLSLAFDSLPARLAENLDTPIDISATFVVELEPGLDALLIDRLRALPAKLASS